MEKEKCLVTEAMDKCQCEWCKLNRKFKQMWLESYVGLEANRIYYESLKNAGVIQDAIQK